VDTLYNTQALDHGFDKYTLPHILMEKQLINKEKEEGTLRTEKVPRNKGGEFFLRPRAGKYVIDTQAPFLLYCPIKKGLLIGLKLESE